MTTRSIQFFQVLKTRLGEREAEAVVDYVDTNLHENNRQMQETLATKQDMANLNGSLREEMANISGSLRHEMANIGGSLRQEMANLRGEIRTDMANLRGELTTKIAEVKSDVIRWTFAFFVTLMLAILGLYLKK